MGYSKYIRHHVMNPINGNAASNYNCYGNFITEERCRTNPDRVVRNEVKFRLLIEADGKISKVRWSVFGDPVAIATSSWCTELIQGKTIDDLVHLVTPERAAMDLEIWEEVDIRGGCMAAIGALMAAISDYCNRTHMKKPWPPIHLN